MNKDCKNIKKDLYEIYSYFKYISDNSTIKSIYSKEFLDKFRYTLKEVYDILELPENNDALQRNNTAKLKKEISNISDISTLRDFYYKNIADIFNAEIDEEYKKQILNSITIQELKYLYSIISKVPIKNYKKKKDIILKFKTFFDDESRTNDMNKKLMY